MYRDVSYYDDNIHIIKCYRTNKSIEFVTKVW